jgi:uncharacterized protein
VTRYLTTWHLVATLICLTPVTTFAQPNPTPSFNCKRAVTEAELAICASPSLAAQDRAIASLYNRVRAATPTGRRPALRADQQRFLRARDNCYGPEGNGIDCLEGSLAERVRELNRWLRSGYR